MSILQPGPTSTTQRALTGHGARPPLADFSLAALAGAAGVVALSAVLMDMNHRGIVGVVVGLLLYLAAAWVAGAGLLRSYPHAVLGLCNVVTLVRLVIVAVLAAALISGEGPSWAGFLLAAIALSLDGVDGWLARRQRLQSRFGARFDVEVDAALALVLALHAALGGSAGFLVVFLGLPYYLFALAGLALPWLGRPLPERFSRKAVCVAQIAVLVALQLPLVTPGALDPLVVAVALALIWSFGRDISWHWRTRP